MGISNFLSSISLMNSSRTPGECPEIFSTKLWTSAMQECVWVWKLDFLNINQMEPFGAAFCIFRIVCVGVCVISSSTKEVDFFPFSWWRGGGNESHIVS